MELVGTDRGLPPWQKNEPAHPGLELTVADIALLAPYLRDDWFIPAISFWRDFSPDRTLHTTREAVGAVIEHVAKHDFFDFYTLARMSDEERERVIQAIIQWSHDNQGKSEADLLVQSLEEDLQRSTVWSYAMAERAKRLAQLGDQRVRPLLRGKDGWALDLLRELDENARKEAWRNYRKYALIGLPILVLVVVGWRMRAKYARGQ